MQRFDTRLKIIGTHCLRSIWGENLTDKFAISPVPLGILRVSVADLSAFHVNPRNSKISRNDQAAKMILA